MAWALPSHSVKPQQLTLSKLPQVFERNQGQFDSQYAFIAQTPATFFSFAKNHVSLVLNSRHRAPEKNLLMRFLNANTDPSITGLTQQTQRVNYFQGKASQWISNVVTFEKIKYQNLYPGVDLTYYFKQSKMEFDFIIAPGADPNQVAFQIENADSIKLSSDGELNIILNGDLLIQKAPVLYQWINGKQIAVSGKFVLDNNIVRFSVGSYHHQYALVIDPVIEFSSYFGGQWEDQANVIRTDSNGNIFVAGATSARAKITVANLLSSEATALSPSANVDNGVLFQNEHGISLDADVIAGSKLDLIDNRKITKIDDVVTTVDYQYSCGYRYQGFFNNDRIVVDYDAFVSKFDSDFNLIFTTYIGGCRNDSIRAMTIDDNDNVYVTGITLSEDFPVRFPAQSTIAPTRFEDGFVQGDAFYAKFNNDGRLLFSSFLGGDGQDGGRDITVDGDENIYITGYSHSRNLATTPCPLVGESVVACENIGGIDEAAAEAGSSDISVFSDAFVAKITSDGDVVVFLTYFGGEFDDWGQSIKVFDNKIYIAGNTASSDLPVGESGAYSYMPYNINKSKEENVTDRKELFCTRLQEESLVSLRIADAHVCQDVFLAMLNIDGTEVLISTYLGGDNDDNVSKIQIDSAGNIYLIGTTKSQGVRLESGSANTLMSDNVLEDRFPLYKNFNDYEFDINSNSTSAFFAVFNPTADTLIVSSFIGGNDNDTGNAIAIRENPINGNGETLVDIYLAGHTLSSNFFTKNAFQSNAAQSDIYLVNLSLDLSKQNDDYDRENPDNPELCSKNSCNLYQFNYSTLIGGEKLDSLKSISLLPNNGGLVVAGITFSSLFPVSSNATKKTIEPIELIQLTPFTEEEIDRFIFLPSDAFVMKITDDTENADLSLSVSVSGENEINEGQDINYLMRIENKSGTTAKSVRLLIKHPYITRIENLEEFVRINLSQCEKDIKQMYCIIGDLAASAIKDVTLKIKTSKDGTFSLSAAVSGITADNVKDNNTITKSIIIRNQINSAGVNVDFLFIMLFLIIGNRFLGLHLNPNRFQIGVQD